MKRLDIFPHVSGQRCAGAPSRPHNHHATGWFIPFQYYFAMPSVCVCVSECVGLGEGDVWKWNDWAVGLDCGHWDAGFDHWTIEASSSHVSISGVIWVMNFGRVTKYNIQRRTGISAFSGISNEWRTQHDPTRWSHFHCLLYIFFFLLLYFILLGFSFEFEFSGFCCCCCCWRWRWGCSHWNSRGNQLHWFIHLSSSHSLSLCAFQMMMMMMMMNLYRWMISLVVSSLCWVERHWRRIWKSTLNDNQLAGISSDNEWSQLRQRERRQRMERIFKTNKPRETERNREKTNRKRAAAAAAAQSCQINSVCG